MRRNYPGDTLPKTSGGLIFDNLTNDLLENISDQGTVLGSSKSSGKNGGVYFGGGWCCSGGINGTGGISGSFGSSKSTAMSSFMDINGDGLPDKIFKDGGVLKYRPNLGYSGDEDPGFGDPIAINAPGFGEISRTTSTSLGWGAKASFFVFAGYSRNESKSVTQSYFSDVNGDGYIDHVNGGLVLFNKGASEVSFSTDNFETPNPITQGTISDEEIIAEATLETLTQLNDENPLHDVVRVWVAPKTGNINISGDVFLELHPSAPSPEAPIEDYDGVRATIQHENTIIEDFELTPTFTSEWAVNLNAQTINESLHVNKGDFIFFRVQSVNEGSFDRVKWNPVIDYTGADSDNEDANGLKYFSSSASEGFILSAPVPYTMPKGGGLEITWNAVPQSSSPYFLSDNLTFEIERGHLDGNTGAFISDELYTASYDHTTGGNITDLSFSPSLPQFTSQDEIFIFRVKSDSNVDWKRIDWKPIMKLTDHNITIPVVVNYEIFREKLYPVESIVEVDTQYDLEIIPTFDEDEFEDEEDAIGGTFTLVVKDNNRHILHKQTFTIAYDDVNEEVFIDGDEVPIVVPADDLTEDIFVEFYTENRYIADVLRSNSNVLVANFIQNMVPLSSQSKDVYYKAPNHAFGPMYRNWGQFGYHGGIVIQRNSDGEVILDDGEPVIIANYGYNINNPSQVNKINIGVLEDAIADFSSCANSSDMLNCVENIPVESPTRMRFIRLAPNPNPFNPSNENDITPQWEGSSTELSVEEEYMSASRYGVKNLNEIYIETPEFNPSNASCDATEFVVPLLISKSNGRSVSTGAGYGGASVGYSTSNSESWSAISYMDMNGDRYPDVITKDRVLFTNPRGAFESASTALGFGNITLSRSTFEGATASGTFNFAKGKEAKTTNGDGDTSNTTNGSTTATPQTQVGSSMGIDVSASSGSNVDESLWLDMNGDGLPDRVKLDGGISVRLNLGYRLAEEKQWTPNSVTLSSTTENFAGGAGWSSGNNSFAGGVTVSASKATVQRTLLDVNGDGLLDLLTKTSNGSSYQLNMGNRFGPGGPIPGSLPVSRSTAEGLNVSSTIPVNIPFFGIKFAIQVSFGLEQSVTREEHAIMDINGDGFPDILYTNPGDDDGNLSVKLSNIGKAQLLKKVSSPMGGTWEVTYKRVGNTTEMPHSKFVLDKIITFDGFSGDNQWSPDRRVTAVSYEEPNYDRREREFMGFAQVTIEQYKGFNEFVEDPYDMDMPERYRLTIQQYETGDYYLKGAIRKETVKDNDQKIWMETTTVYGLFEPGVPATAVLDGFTATTYGDLDTTSDIDEVPNSNDCFSLKDYSRIFVAPVATIMKFTEGGDNAKYAVTVNEAFDAYGNIVRFRDYGEQNDDVYVATIEYSAPLSGIENSVGYPKFLRIWNADQSTLLRQREAQYDSFGNLEKVITKLNNTDFSTISIQHDEYGNVKKVINEDNLSDSDVPTSAKFFREYTYDDVVFTYPVRVEDAFGYFSTAEYNLLFGVPVYTVDMNLQPMRTRLDDRGRVVEITGPYELFAEGVAGGSEPAWTIRFEYHGEDSVAERVDSFAIDQYGPIETDGYNGVVDASSAFTGTAGLYHALTRHFDPEFRDDPDSVVSQNQILTSTLIDGFGKVVQVKKSGVIFDGTATPSTENVGNVNVEADNTRVWILNEKVLDDGYGRAAETYYPTWQADSFNGLASNVSFVPDNAFQYVPAASSAEPTVTTYDVLDRPLTTTMPGETTSSSVEYTIQDDRFVTTMTNELGQIQKTFADIRKRTTRTLQESVTGFISTEFLYNNLGELLKVTDVAGNETESKYDLAGRRTELKHPDNGLTKFTYDKAGNLTMRITSNLLLAGNNDAIRYKYNFGRLSEINYDQFPENKVQYFYGTSGNADAANDNAVGRLWYQADASGAQYFKYGRLGELVRNRRSVAVPGDRVYWFQTDWTYDTWNRVKTIKYPDEELVTYHYNHGGSLHAITTDKPGQGAGKNIISQMNYDQFGQRVYLRYGNGTETSYTYEVNRRRLEHLKVGSSEANGAALTRTFIDNLYDYDVLSNVRGIYNNTVELPGNDQIGGRSWQQYTYDDLNRLTTATGHFMGRNENGGFAHQKYTLGMSYDSQHNILLKTQVHEMAISPTETAGDWTQVEATTYALDYRDYNTGSYTVDGFAYGQPHAPRTVVDQPVAPGCCDGQTDPRVKTKTFEYDANGNQTRALEKICTAEEPEAIRENLWDNEDRLRAVDMNPNATEIHPIAVYTYDAGGERIVKHNATSITI